MATTPAASVRSTLVKRIISDKTKQRAAVTFDALARSIALASTAQIPLVGGAFGVANEMINTFKAVGDNNDASHALLVLVETHADSICEFVQAIPKGCMQSSDPANFRAQVARDAVQTFSKNLESVYDVVSAATGKRYLSQLASSASIKAEYANCLQKLTSAHVRFHDARSNILVKSVYVAETVQSPVEEDPGIAGAKLIDQDDLDLVKRVSMPRREGSESFWSDIYKAKVGNEDKLVKMYYPKKSGGKKSWDRDIEWLRENVTTNMPRVYGYCATSATPFIVFRQKSITPLNDHLRGIAAVSSGEEAVLTAWRMLIDMKEAAEFLLENNDEIRKNSLTDLLHDTTVDENGSVVLAMPTSRRPGVTAPNVFDRLTSVWRQHLLSDSLGLRSLRPMVFCLDPFGWTKNREMWEAAALNDTTRAMELLRALIGMTTADLRIMTWPVEGTEGFEQRRLGDVGHFERGKTSSLWSFKCHGNHRQEGGLLSLRVRNLNGGKVDNISEGVFRYTAVSPEVGNAAEDVTGQYDDDDDPEDINYLLFRWESSFEPEEAFGFLAQEARRLGSAYQVAHDDLTLITETTGWIAAELDVEAVKIEHKALYLYFCLDEHGWPANCYWSFSETPLTADETQNEKDAMVKLGCGAATIIPDPPRYMQVETWQVKEAPPVYEEVDHGNITEIKGESRQAATFISDQKVPSALSNSPLTSHHVSIVAVFSVFILLVILLFR
ncbi:hypothetical protein FRB94_004849 [Tulasnella sp. JGI-2019a]|nr:hypothetical protein FRB93_005830 [Tulasnella sp. JGI-2019a]KAG9001301.1 hypothetical protein FRB94_004849 [Tulasnella sp. JGI-2019a]